MANNKEQSREQSREQMALYRRWNPTKLEDICGNALAVSKCKTLIESAPSQRPGFYLVTGETGTGKSTITHILAHAFGCDYIEVFNSRDAGKLDFVTDFLTNHLPVPHITAHARAYIFEEAHNITVAAQEMFMEPMEKGVPPNTYVFFVTNAPERLTGGKGALASRPFVIKTEKVSSDAMEPRLEKINSAEGLGLNDVRIAFCAKYSNGSMRRAINNMARLAAVPNDLWNSEMLAIKMEYEEMEDTDVPPNVKELAIALETGDWDKVAPVLKRLKDSGDDPEGIRRAMLAWYSGILLSDKRFCRSKREFARTCLLTLKDNYYSCGFAGLVCDLSHLVVKGID